MRTLFVSLSCMLALGCNSKSGGGNTSIGQSVGASGATLTIASGSLAGLRLVIPSGGLPAATNITVVADAGPASAAMTPVGNAGLFGPGGTTFTPSATLTMAYDPSRLPAGVPESAVSLVRRDTAGTVTVLPSVVDAANDTVTAQIPGFSVYQPQVVVQTEFVTIGDYFNQRIGIDYQFQNDFGARTVGDPPAPLDTVPAFILELFRSAGDQDDGAIGLVLDADLANNGLRLLGLSEFNFEESILRTLSQGEGVLLSAPRLVFNDTQHEANIVVDVYEYGQVTPLATGTAKFSTTFVEGEPLVTPVGTFDDVIEMNLAIELSVEPEPKPDSFGIAILLARDVGPVGIRLPGQDTSLIIGGLIPPK
jgi:hypothetical protein